MVRTYEAAAARGGNAAGFHCGREREVEYAAIWRAGANRAGRGWPGRNGETKDEWRRRSRIGGFNRRSSIPAKHLRAGAPFIATHGTGCVRCTGDDTELRI